MKHIIWLVIIFAIVGLAGYYFLSIDDSQTTVGTPTTSGNGTTTTQTTTFSDPAIGLEFQYRPGPSGYVLEEAAAATGTEDGLVKSISLIRTEDQMQTPPQNGEGPPTIAIHVFSNTENQQAEAWAEDHVQYSNINLVQGDVQETVVGGANAVRYMADGLYASENVVVPHGDRVYVFTGQFLDADSDLRRDFQPLVSSIRFIPQPGQE